MQSSVLLILLNQEKNILLQHRSKDAPTYPNQWGFFGGSIEAGEMPEEAARRELKEELDIEVQTLQVIGNFIDPEDLVERYAFMARIDFDVATLKARQTEGDDLKFFSLEEIKNLPFMTPTRIRLLKQLF
jgi:8-oxo-dGTP diphosphatase